MKVLVVTHDSTLSGAPRVALLVARLMVEAGHDVRVLSRTPGAMLSQFARVAPTRVEVAHRWRGRLWRRAPRLVALALDATLATLTLLVQRPDLVYVNSTSAALYARVARWVRVPAIALHVHESGANSDVFLRRAGLRRFDQKILWVACSPSVQHELAELLDLPEGKIVMLPSVPDDQYVRAQAEADPIPGYGAEGLVIGCCGTAEFRKGVDLWQVAAAKVLATVPDLDLRLVWVGAREEAPSGPVEFLGPVENPYPHLRRFDLLVLPSRDDPFPLVVLEAMMLGTPVVAFDVGAVRAQVGEAGVMVPAEHTDALAEAVIRLVLDDGERLRLGRQAAARATAHFSTAAFSRSLEDLVDDVTRLGRATADHIG